jgi:hypothetical protein
MYDFKILLIISIIALSIVACNNNPAKKEDVNSNVKPDFKELVNDWNNAHNTKDIDLFKKLYASSVNFYQSELTNEICVNKKSSLLKTNKDFNQVIIGEIEIEYLSDTEVKCSFTKKASWNGKTEQYPSYLIFVKIGSKWKISTESDLLTDSNIQKKNNQNKSERIAVSFGDNSETMWLEYPKFKQNANEDYYSECEGSCECNIQFSDPSIPAIKIDNCIGGTPVNEGDLNGDGYDEIGILPEWWTSCWHEYKVYSLENNKWELLVSATTHCDQWEKGVDCVSKDKAKPGYIIVKYSEFNDNGIVLKTKSTKLDF